MGESGLQSNPDSSPVDDLEGTVLTVDELNAQTSHVISQARTSELDFDFLVGDVSDDSVSDGTRFFDLVNSDAKITCLVFDDVRPQLPEFEEGDRVAVTGRLNFYEKRGGCSLYIDNITLLGESHYHTEISRIRHQLTDEGVFSDDTKQPLPEYPSTVGIVTASGSDAEADALHAIQSRNQAVDICLHDARVQGMSALRDLCSAIIRLDKTDAVDVIVVTRGGGSEQSLHVFNTVGVCRTVSECATPVVTAIGHEEDRPLVDDAADGRAMTPTDVGEVTVASLSHLCDRISRISDDLTAAYSRLYTDTKSRLTTQSAEASAGHIQTTVSHLADSLSVAHNQLHTNTIPQMTTQLNHSYTTGVDRTTGELSDSLTASYDSHMTRSLSGLHTALTTSYSQQTTTRTVTLSNELTRAYESFEQRKKHAEETTAIRQSQQQYKRALAGLVVVLLVVISATVLVVL